MNYVHVSNELDVSNTFKFVKQNTYMEVALQHYRNTATSRVISATVFNQIQPT